MQPALRSLKGYLAYPKGPGGLGKSWKIFEKIIADLDDW
jgi:hypothetical protein